MQLSVAWRHEPEVWTHHGKYVSLRGTSYLLKDLNIVGGADRIPVTLIETKVPEGEQVFVADHWMRD